MTSSKRRWPSHVWVGGLVALGGAGGLAVSAGRGPLQRLHSERDQGEVARGESAARPTLGIDSWRYPGDSTMARWRRLSPYRWVGYYLAAPCRVDSSWVGTRRRLERMGWGLAVLYVGQQAWQHDGPHTGTNAPRAGARGVCAASQLSRRRGGVDGLDAVRQAAREGFTAGTVLFLDVERMESLSRGMRDYYQAWTRAVLADGRYGVGVYVHERNAARVVADVRAECGRARNAHATSDCPRAWISAPHDFRRSALPSASGHAFADVWQGAIDTTETWGGTRLSVDVNVSIRASPSTPAHATAAPGRRAPAGARHPHSTRPRSR